MSSLICSFDEYISVCTDMLSLDQIRKSLGSNAAKHSEEELIIIRREMYQFAYFAYDFYYNHRKTPK